MPVAACDSLTRTTIFSGGNIDPAFRKKTLSQHVIPSGVVAVMARHCCNAMRVEACVCQVNACAGIYGGEHYSDLGGGVRVAPNIPVDVDPVAWSPMGDGAPSRAGPIAKLFRDFAAFARLDFDGDRCVVVGGGYRVGRAGPPCIQFCGEQIKSLRRRQEYINRLRMSGVMGVVL